MAGNDAVKKAAGSIGVGTVLGYGFDAFDLVSTFADSRKQGHGFIRSVGDVAFQQAMWTYAAPLQWTMMGVDLAKTIGGAVMENGRNQGKVIVGQQNRQYRSSFGGNFVDNKQSYTMRQRGVQALQQSGNSVNSVLGNEARQYHRGVY